MSMTVVLSLDSTLESPEDFLNMMMAAHLPSCVSWAFLFLILHPCRFLVLSPFKRAGYSCSTGYPLVCVLQNPSVP